MQDTIKKANILTFPVAAPFDIAYRNDSPATPVGPHSHNAAELYFTLSHLPDVLLNDTVTAVPPGTLIIIPAFCVHQLYHETGTFYERYILSINSQWLDTVFCKKADCFTYLKQSSAPFLLTPDSTERENLLNRFRQLLSSSNITTPGAMADFFELLSLLDDIIDRLSPESNHAFPISAAQERVNEVIAYIQEHIYDNLTVTDLAKHFFLHPDYLSRLFKRHAHTSVCHYITLQKIATAQNLLREGYTVTQVQEKLDYSSYAYFFKAFQKNAGISPSRYRAMVNE
ncbi:MAG: AraC family transcriptional regulator [Lachnospiraceae bacterium]|nr:AraC family transcriptional regulator [Lachnospiraceae bacterium]